MIHSFLMIGQSNMAGRGFIKEVPQIFDTRIKMLRNGCWQTMVEPVNYDRPTSGVSLASSFAAAWLLKNNQQEIGLIPCADGGTSLDDWAVGGRLFDHAVCQAKLAMRNSKLSGILWHQGESDCFPERIAVYQQQFSVITDALRRELNAPEIPLIIGGLGDFLPDGIYGQYFTLYQSVNEALLQFAQTQPNCYFVSAAGLTANPDGLHFNAASLRTFGIRYFKAYDKRANIEQPGNENETLRMIYERPFTQKEKTALLDLRFASGELSADDYKEQMTRIQR